MGRVVLVLRFELRLNLARAYGLLVIDCRFELHIPDKSIKAGALTIELDEHKRILIILVKTDIIFYHQFFRPNIISTCRA